MSLDGNGLGDEIISEIENSISLPPNYLADMTPIWQAIGRAVVKHIQDNAEVSTDVTGNGLATLPVQVVPATGTGATTAPDSITGTGTGTIA